MANVTLIGTLGLADNMNVRMRNPMRMVLNIAEQQPVLVNFDSHPDMEAQCNDFIGDIVKLCGTITTAGDGQWSIDVSGVSSMV